MMTSPRGRARLCAGWPMTPVAANLIERARVAAYESRIWIAMAKPIPRTESRAGARWPTADAGRMSDSMGARLHRMAEEMPQTVVRTGSAESGLDSTLKRGVAFL
ncbi:hypothetical protein PI87_18430 [Ralstonia sp. A12]|nr:hypothetical protein PI87_18430 [Ralstonia sp. A12]